MSEDESEQHQCWQSGEGVVGEEIREATGRDREGFSTYCHKAKALPLNLNPGAPLEFNAKMNKAVWNRSLTPA